MESTITLLSKAGINEGKVFTPDDMCRILGVDGILTSNYSLTKPMSESAAIGVGIIAGVWGPCRHGHLPQKPSNVPVQIMTRRLAPMNPGASPACINTSSNPIVLFCLFALFSAIKHPLNAKLVLKAPVIISPEHILQFLFHSSSL